LRLVEAHIGAQQAPIGLGAGVDRQAAMRVEAGGIGGLVEYLRPEILETGAATDPYASVRAGNVKEARAVHGTDFEVFDRR
jgi:hypothetical protein